MKNKPTILIADDAASIRLVVRETLTQMGFAVVEAENGAEALAQFVALKEAGTPPKLILTDLRMPIMDGMTFMREVRKRDRRVPILIVTTSGLEDEKKEARKAGANGWVMKPIHSVSFSQTVKRFTG